MKKEKNKKNLKTNFIIFAQTNILALIIFKISLISINLKIITNLSINYI